MVLKATVCPSCGSKEIKKVDNFNYVCSYCHSTFVADYDDADAQVYKAANNISDDEPSDDNSDNVRTERTDKGQEQKTVTTTKDVQGERQRSFIMALAVAIAFVVTITLSVGMLLSSAFSSIRDLSSSSSDSKNYLELNKQETLSITGADGKTYSMSIPTYYLDIDEDLRKRISVEANTEDYARKTESNVSSEIRAYGLIVDDESNPIITEVVWDDSDYIDYDYEFTNVTFKNVDLIADSISTIKATFGEPTEYSKYSGYSRYKWRTGKYSDRYVEVGQDPGKKSVSRFTIQNDTSTSHISLD